LIGLGDSYLFWLPEISFLCAALSLRISISYLS
jgi:hypothetical protein